MPLTNTHQRYGGVTKTFHWLTALLILTLILLGWIADELPFDTDTELARKAWLFSLHKTLGVAAFFVAVARILWALSQPHPGLLNADKRLESFLASLVHWLLYGALVIVPLSGWIGHAAASGFAPIWWPLGQNLPLVPKDTNVEHFFGALHWAAGRVLIGAIFLHIAGALKHHMIDRDSTLRRMLPGTPVIGTLPPQHRSKAPLIAAVALWAATFGFAAVVSRGDAAEPATAPALAQVSSEWQVQQGQIEISVNQFGSTVTGQFADWTAEIDFDETSDMGKAGTVTTTIAIPSLTLGSVTGQALAPDFFDAPTFPTARFTADILHGSDGYIAQGRLTIKDQSLPFAFPFSLAINGEAAEMRADLTLDRRDFGIGSNVNDENTLGFAVTVKITLTAQRGE